MKKILVILSILVLIIPSVVGAAPSDGLKAAFIRHNQLWIKIGNNERKLTSGEFIKYPKWSSDGNWIAYLKGKNENDVKLFQGELWVYNVKQNRHFKIDTNVNNNFQWAPHADKLGFIKNNDLFLFDFHNRDTLMASNIENFSWLPSGIGFLTSSKETEELDSDIILSKVIIKGKNKRPSIKHFFTIPVEKDEYLVSTSIFKWSDNQSWISFLLIPTASLSADSNILCILSHDGKIFRKVDDILNYEEWFNWAPSRNTLGYISGVGREATTNKQLKILHVPSMKKEVFTPKGYADRDFTFQNNHILYISRSIASTEGNLNKRPLPALYKINLSLNKQSKLTTSSKKIGDFQPKAQRNKLVWIRTNRINANVLVSPNRIFRAQPWIRNIDVGSSYYEKWSWDEVFSLYRGI